MEEDADRPGKLFHNYGHGGSGFTCSVGCARAVVGLVEEALRRAVTAPQYSALCATRRRQLVPGLIHRPVLALQADAALVLDLRALPDARAQRWVDESEASQRLVLDALHSRLANVNIERGYAQLRKM